MNANQLLEHFHRIGDAPDAIPRLRRFILDLAVRGKLVPQDPRDEPVSELLKRIAKEKARLGLKQEVSPLGSDEMPFGLPQGWFWSRIGGLLEDRLREHATRWSGRLQEHRDTVLALAECL